MRKGEGAKHFPIKFTLTTSVLSFILSLTGQNISLNRKTVSGDA